MIIPRKQALKTFFNTYIFESPFWKTLISAVLPILSGFFSGTLIVEITKETGISWKEIPKTKSFYVLIFLITFIYTYNRAVYLREKEIMRFLDNDYCIAYMRSQCLPEAANRFKELIREGQGGEFKQAMDELKKVLKK